MSGKNFVYEIISIITSFHCDTKVSISIEFRENVIFERMNNLLQIKRWRIIYFIFAFFFDANYSIYIPKCKLLNRIFILFICFSFSRFAKVLINVERLGRNLSSGENKFTPNDKFSDTKLLTSFSLRFFFFFTSLLAAMPINKCLVHAPEWKCIVLLDWVVFAFDRRENQFLSARFTWSSSHRRRDRADCTRVRDEEVLERKGERGATGGVRNESDTLRRV